MLGGIAGAVAGGVYGYYVDQHDKTGEGFTAPIMIAAGSVVGALLGTAIGLLWPVR